MAEIAVKAQEELFRLAITKLLRTHMTFAMDSPDFSQASLQKIVICKNSSMRILFNPIFNFPILSFGQGKNNQLLQSDNIKEDQFAPLTHKQEETETDTLEIDQEMEESERKIWTSLDIQHGRDVIKLQTTYSV